MDEKGWSGDTGKDSFYDSSYLVVDIILKTRNISRNIKEKRKKQSERDSMQTQSVCAERKMGPDEQIIFV